jgi:putative N6-adenine-specific DNA methylase
MKFAITAKTFHGLEQALANEISNLGGEDIEIGKRAVLFTGDKKTLYRINYESRLCLTVLVPVFNFEAKTTDDIYAGTKRINWDDFLSVQTTFSIQTTVNSEIFNHSRYVALKVKDAIVDQIREKYNDRPSVDTENPDLKINVHVNDTEITISLDSSGEPLYKRGYRKKAGEAHLNEVLAAGLIVLSEWNTKTPLLDPMCGSGTILAEAAMLATNMPAGKFRKEFGFQKWKDYDEKVFNNVKKEADLKITNTDVPLTGFDISPQNVEIARINTAFLKNNCQISIVKADMLRIPAPYSDGWIIVNPPYGERLKSQSVSDLYAEMGTTLKHRYAGFSAWIISSNLEALKNIGLKTSRKITIYNGPLECKFQRYDLYTGTKKVHKSEQKD